MNKLLDVNGSFSGSEVSGVGSDTSSSGSNFSSSRRAKRNINYVNRLASRTHFTSEEVISLLNMHTRMTKQGILDRLRFREVIHACFDFNEDMMLDRVYRAFDKNNDGFVSAVEWVEGCSVLIRGTPEELIDYTYFVYDINGDGSIVREELQRYLKKSVFQVPNVLQQEEVEDGEKDMIDYAMKKLDKDRDGQITYADYEKACRKDPLLVQSLGHCIPSAKSCAAFLACFTEQYRSYTPLSGEQWSKGFLKQDYHIGPSAPRRSFDNSSGGDSSRRSSLESGEPRISGDSDAAPGSYRSRRMRKSSTPIGLTRNKDHHGKHNSKETLTESRAVQNKNNYNKTRHLSKSKLPAIKFRHF